MRPLRWSGRRASALTLLGAALLPAVLAAVLTATALAAGPPYPPPEEGRVVYDTAGVFGAPTIASASSTIRAIEERTGAEVVVYTQLKPESDTVAEAEADAIALMDEWGIGRKGFDDGLVILFDLDESLRHGQVQLYAGPGYRAAFLDNSERQGIFEGVMLPRLRAGDLDGALLAALERIDANATPEHAQALERGRQINGVAGLVGAPVVFLVLVGLALWNWARYGRDPVYLDDPSILMPAPPPDLTAAAGALLMDGRSSRHTLTTALLDLASRGAISFREEKELLGRKVGIELAPRVVPQDFELSRARRRPLSDAERDLLSRLQKLDGAEDGYLDRTEVLGLGSHVATFNAALEDHAVRRAWFRDPPAKVRGRWSIVGTGELLAGVAGAAAGLALPSGGLLLLGGAAALAGVITLLVARSMPARTMAGAMVVAMLAAYRRTLEKTLAQARSMQQVVNEAHIAWLETPDQAVVWGVALGLHEQVEDVIRRSVEDLRAGRTSNAWVPAWYGTTTSGSSGGPFGASIAPGLLASSAVPDVGGMLSAIGTVGNAPASSSGGGFGGGSSGGGGGGAGGGF